MKIFNGYLTKNMSSSPVANFQKKETQNFHQWVFFLKESDIRTFRHMLNYLCLLHNISFINTTLIKFLSILLLFFGGLRRERNRNFIERARYCNCWKEFSSKTSAQIWNFIHRMHRAHMYLFLFIITHGLTILQR